MSNHVKETAACFAVPGTPTSWRPNGRGHIHDSYLLEFTDGERITRGLLQRINTAVFPDPIVLMENIRRVTKHVAARLQDSGAHDVHRKTLTIVPTIEGELLHVDRDGSYWRMYGYIERTTTQEVVVSACHAEQAGRAFGAFQGLLADLPGPRLHEIIPAFHDTPRRFDALDRALRVNSCGRASDAQKEIEFAQSQRPMAGVLLESHRAGEIPERLVHNDAKIGNVLFDEETHKALCVVDLDTVMPGLALFDFGDMMRTMTVTCAEDETDLDRVEVDLPLFEALAYGYIEETSSFLTPAERGRLVLAGRLITLEQGVRFLTDHLCGDPYYGASRPNLNLDRCRTQFKLVESFVRHEEKLVRMVEGC